MSKNKHLQEVIYIKGANGNNLKNVDVKIPKNKLVVVTGVSGSGKSSLVMDTLYAEGQRRYVESLSSYARQFLMRMKKPEVDFIEGICPAIAIEQKVTTGNNRSTVGSMTEIYDYLRLLYARIGHTYSPISGDLVKRHSVTDVVNAIQKLKEKTKIQLFIPFPMSSDRLYGKELELLLQKGYTRLQIDGKLTEIEDILSINLADNQKRIPDLDLSNQRILIDRFAVKLDDEDHIKRISDSVQTAFYESQGDCIIDVIGGKEIAFNNRFELDGMTFLEPTPQLFNYNNPYGACPKCEGYGMVIGIDAEKVIPNKGKSVFEGAIAPWKGDKFGLWLQRFLQVAERFDFPVHRPYQDLTKAEQKLLWTGNNHFSGINYFFDELQKKLYKIQNRVMLARYRGRTKCPDCEGGRLRMEARCVAVGGKKITDLTDAPIEDLVQFFDKLELTDFDLQIGNRLILEIRNRLDYMMSVGLNYLSLNRISSSLSGGETQRINLTRMLGSNLTSSMYILDEPSIGLHPRDTAQLVKVLESLRDLGNTVIVVEHEEEVIKNADFIIDVGVNAGVYGGEIVFVGDYKALMKTKSESLTAKYLNGKMGIDVPKIRRKPTDYIHIKGARAHNLKNIDVKIPLNAFTVITGVSGSGKTTLIKKIFYPALKRALGESFPEVPGAHDEITGDIRRITQVELVNQKALGKSSRSNPVTYVKAYDAIRNLFSRQQLSLINGFKPRHFSFNVEGGRCETCSGDGEQVIEMQFLADVRLTCESCKGKRFKQEVLNVKYKGKSIYDILTMSVDEAIHFFKDNQDILSKIQPLYNVGLGYVQLGQSSSTLSGGEAQRVKLASFLTKENAREKILFIFDEPTTGLHFDDISKLLDALNALVEKGHTVVVVEHNVEVIKSSDWIIDLGPEGGNRGGNLVYQGAPEGILGVEESYTGLFLRGKM